jgi:3-phosphoshikimate 1-carboxyvinyltransferase
VKSCLLLAGLLAEGETTVVEPLATRDHTERMLRAAGARVERHPGAVTVRPATRLELREIEVPGDISSAAFFIVAATLVPESHLFIRGVGVNPGRAGVLTVLERMGARIGLFNRRTTAAGEPIADLEIQHAELVATEVEPEIVPTLIDELPLVALAASRARGTTRVRGAEDLRKKESDRIATVADALTAAGAHVTPTDDGWDVRGVPARLRGGIVDPHGDHRIAMMGAIAGLYSEQGVRVRDPACIDVSFPGFRDILRALEAAVAERE